MLKSTATIMALPNEGSAPPPPLFQYRTRGQPVAHLEPAAGATVSLRAERRERAHASSGGTARAGPAARRGRRTSTRPACRSRRPT